MRAFVKRWIVIFGWTTFLLWVVYMWTMPEASHNPPYALCSGAFLALWFLLPAFVINVLYELVMWGRR